MQWFSAALEKCYKQITAAISRFREIKDRIDEGLKFYATLQVFFFLSIYFYSQHEQDFGLQHIFVAFIFFLSTGINY